MSDTLTQIPDAAITASSAPPAEPVSRRTRLFPLALLSALLLTLAFPPADLAWLAWLALAPIFYAVVHARRAHHAFGLAYLFGFLHWGVVIYWIGSTVANWTHSPIGWIALVLLTALKVCWYGLFGSLAWWAGRRTHGAARVIVVGAAWALVEWCRGQTVVAMPWSLSGYSQYRYLTLIQAADLAGVYLIGFAIALAGAALAEVAGSLGRWEAGQSAGFGAARHQGPPPSNSGGGATYTAGGGLDASEVAASRLTPHASRLTPSPLHPLVALVPPAFCLAFLLVYGLFATHRSYGGEPLRVAVMQPNIASRAGEPETEERDMALYSAMAAQVAPARPQLVLWPESAATDAINDGFARHHFMDFARKTRAWQLVGTGYEAHNGLAYNSGALFAPDGTLAGRYDKYWLVPMGEWVPLRPYIPSPFGDVFHFPPETSRGPFERVLDAGPMRLNVLICYESVFPALSRARVASGANLLVGITNDSWAGESPQLRQHIAMSAFRAVETRRWLASAATTGVTGVVDPTGRIDAVPPYSVQAAIRNVRLRTGITPYVRFGDWFIVLCAAALGAALRQRRRMTDDGS